MRKIILLLASVMSVVLAGVAVAMPSSAAALAGLTQSQARQAVAANPCGQFRFDSLPRSYDGPFTIGPATLIRAERHDCFDRLAVDITGSQVPGWSVRYVNTLVQDASGRTLDHQGRALLEIVLRTNAHRLAGESTLSGSSTPSVEDFREFRDVIFAADFEGQIQLGLGLDQRRPFRVLTLPTRSGHVLWVLDVAHPGTAAQ